MAFISLARLLLDTRDEVINALIAIERGEVGAMRFGCSPLVDPHLFRGLRDLHKELLPSCAIRPTHGDPAQLAEEIASGMVAAALVTLPLRHPDLHIEELSRDRLVVCLRRDNALASKPALQAADLQGNLGVLYHPTRHPDAHTRLLELLSEIGITVKEYSHASHPSEMQVLVKEGHGFTLIREGTTLDDELTTRPLAGVDWTVDTAAVYHKQQHPKTIPILIRKLKRQFAKAEGPVIFAAPISQSSTIPKSGPQSFTNPPVQLELLGKSS
jgi:DNA-binding transcriptional LysR family regulator